MSSMPDRPITDIPGVRRVDEAVDRGVRGALHAMAQPLTILQSRVEAALLLGQTPEPAIELLHTIAEEVERLCALLHPLQFLVTARDRAETASASSVYDLLASVFGDVYPLFDDAGITLCTNVQPAMPEVKIAAASTREAILMMLLAARSTASAGNRVEAAALLAEDAVEVRVCNNGPHQSTLSALYELNMTLAEARALGQQGEFSLTLHPFDARMRLPLAAVS